MWLKIAFFVVCLLAGSARAEWFEVTEPIMGTRVHAEVWHEDPATGRAVLADVISEMRRIEAEYSPFMEDSELSRLNRKAGEGWVETTPEMIDLLEKSAQVSRLTNGAFDITYASVGRYYDYREKARPDDETLLEGLEAINHEYVEIDAAGSRVRFAHPLVYVDLGGIAKGYAVDRCIELIESVGITAAAVAAGGDSRIVGDRQGEPWTVGVQDPRNDDEMAVLLPLVDTAVSTSGDYERFFVEDGVRYHHILDPRTGDSARESWSVTILGPEATFTDAMSTSVFVLGPEKGLALIDRLPGIDAIVIDAQGRLRYSADLAEAAGVPSAGSRVENATRR
jgi:thiamine biosynthesis lipoprotein